MNTLDIQHNIRIFSFLKAFEREKASHSLERAGIQTNFLHFIFTCYREKNHFISQGRILSLLGSLCAYDGSLYLEQGLVEN